MVDLDLIRRLSVKTPSKIVLLTIDGLGGLPDPATGKSELETANIPNMDKLASLGISGMSDPIGPGITPGSAPGHLALFGYNPLEFNIGRGVLEAIGIDVELQQGDVATRGNFCTLDESGNVTDRRAGRISTERCIELCEVLSEINIPNVKVTVHPVREHRFVAVFHGEYLAAEVTESDPQRTGVPPAEIRPLVHGDSGAIRLSEIANQFIKEARERLADYHPANMILLRGFSRQPKLPTMQEVYKISPLAVAIYPMYRGLARLVGMEVAEAGNTLEEEFETVKKYYQDYDFFFVHIKGTDSAGEDGDFSRKCQVLEQVNAALPVITELKPDVLVITGDHSTPAVVRGHSWHPVPALIVAENCRPDAVEDFSERAFLCGGLGRLNATQIIHVTMANAMKLRKYGA
ncbi:MAG: 2,3-bisphosphoglycerate-independent phosphoglycerate mutase [Dehalococcoidia bacterium]|jgi:2,3-bisphosphoglycerate-independent phosphoglycerate mutase